MSVPVQSAGSGGKVLTAFIAGLTLGVIGMVEIAPSSLAGSAGPQAAVQDDGSTVPLEGPTDVASDGGTGADVEVGAAQPRTADPSGADGGGDGAQGSAGGGGAAGSVGGGGAGSAGASGGGGGGSGCAANNGGATDTGVSATEIKVAATTVTDGPGATLLAPATDGMRAVLDKVNANGGICGRRITLTTRNDAWDDKRGRDFLRKFIEEGNFSLLVVPSSEGLALAIETGLISDNKIPVVGSTGLRQDEYSDPWVFPVSTATVSIMRIMAQHAYDQGSRTFGIAWDEFYKFGQEGRDEFVAQVNRLPGTTLKADVALSPTASRYHNEAREFNNRCGDEGCDMVALLMVPDMALLWKDFNGDAGQGRGTQMTYGAQTLFTNDFATECKAWCNGLVVWTGYNPSIGSLADRPDIRQYRTDVRNVNPSADTDNQFLQGAYLGSKVFVEAVTQCSPNVTRVCVRDTLNQMDYASDLSSTLSWRPNKRHANTAARAFRMQASGKSFNGWQDTGFGFVEDPQL